MAFVAARPASPPVPPPGGVALWPAVKLRPAVTFHESSDASRITLVGSVYRAAWQGAFPRPCAAIPYALFVIYPILYVIVLSTFRWDGISPNRTFVGLDNYGTLLNGDPIFWVALRNTLTWTFLSLTIPTTIGLGLALVLNQPFRGRTFFRALFYVPAVLGSISVALMWIWIYNPSLGVVNSVLKGLGLAGMDPSMAR